MVLDDSKAASKRLELMLFGMSIMESLEEIELEIEAIFAIKRTMKTQPLLKITIPNLVDEELLNY